MPYLDTDADEVMVKKIMDYLIKSMDKFADKNPNYAPIDLFLGVHNFHVVTILSIEHDMEITDPKGQLLLRAMA